jgi:hypothetical protein
MRRAVLAFVLVAACASTAGAPTLSNVPLPMSGGGSSFAADVAFLRAHGDVVVLESPRGGKVAVSPTYQGRVMTSAFSAGAPSLGWIHRAFIESGKTGTQFDNYGGEDRFWLGPEGGQLALYFPPGKPFDFASWQTPHQLQEGAWAVASCSSTQITLTRRLAVTNYAGTVFDVSVERTIRLVEPDTPALIHATMVAYESRTTITNVGATAWSRASGMPSIWILAMFAPADDAKIVIPFRRDAKGAVVNDAYFGKIAADRLRVDEDRSCVVLVADGKSRGKLGLAPARSTGVLASYAPSTRTLTIVRTAPPDSSKPYVDNLWEKRADPYEGDAVNAYNDGPTEPGKASLGGFYELETSSPAAELAPGASLTHTHSTLHVLVDDAVRATAGTLGIDPACLFEQAGRSGT